MKSEFDNWEIEKNLMHVALCTYPQYTKSGNDSHDTFIKNKEEYYRRNAKNPSKILKYHLFSNFDIAFLSIVDSHEIAQKVFGLPEHDREYKKPVSYQLMTGAVPNHIGINKNGCFLENFFDRYDTSGNQYDFVLII